MQNRLTTSSCLSFFLALSAFALPPDYSKEPTVIQNLTTLVNFSEDGARDWQQTVSVRVQSEAAVRQFGVLSFSYAAESEQLNLEYVRVRKADGSVVETPASSMLDVASEVANSAPTYSDLRQKQVPVKGLGVGDVLEYSVHNLQRKPEVPGQFWYNHYFVNEGVILNETLEIAVPRQKFVQVVSEKLKSETRDAGDQRIYTWKHANLEPLKPGGKKPESEPEPIEAQITSFRNWQEVGDWWAALATPQIAVTPAIQSKANELTAGLSSDSAKAKAIYNYVGMKFRYISISLGAGKYRPHSAQEVLANQYGDCKDKHTLFAALLKAAGIRAWPALIGSGLKFDAAVPSPAQFNHVITVLPGDGKYQWLDTTAEVAPFGLLMQTIRDQQALVIPAEGKPILMKTPIDPPFASSNRADVKSVLAADGTLTGHFDFRMAGDGALLLRGAFRQIAPAQWQALAQQLSYALAYAGDVSAVDLENLEELDKPFHYSYDYNRKNYSDWAEHKITPPIPPIAIGPGDEAEKPKEPFWTGAPGTVTYRGSIQLPKGFTLNPPGNVTLTSSFAIYSAQYSLKDGTLTAERELVIKRSKVAPEQWEEYQKFCKGLRDDQTNFIAVEEIASKDDEGTRALMDRATDAIRAGNIDEARSLALRIESLSPKQAELWELNGELALRAGRLEEALADFRKEIDFHPDEVPPRQRFAYLLENAGRREEAIKAWHSVLSITPDDPNSSLKLARLLIQGKQYSEVPAILEKPITMFPDRTDLKLTRIEALLRSGHKEQGLLEARKLAESTAEPTVLNDLAYYVDDTASDAGVAQGWAEKAVGQIEQNMSQLTLSKFEKKDLASVGSLAAAWDTLGWIYFHQNDFPKAQKYVNAAWMLSQHAPVADHLGEIYEKQGKHDAAVHMWRLALASDFKYDAAKDRLRNAGAAVDPPRLRLKDTSVLSPSEELGAMRTIKIPELRKQTGSAEFFLLISHAGIEDAQLVSQSAAFQEVVPLLRSAKYEFPIPDAGPEKIIRRGILSCSVYTTPSCQLTMFLPSTVKMADSIATPPTLISRVEPKYSEAARQAKLEGSVLLGIVIGIDGVPRDVTVIRSLGMGLDESAKDCVVQWRFKPATKDGKPVQSSAKAEINFVLQKNPGS